MPYFPSGYGAVAGVVGTTTVGAVIAHTHGYDHIAGGGSLGIAGGTSNLGIFSATTTSTGGSANFGAGSAILFCVKYL